MNWYHHIKIANIADRYTKILGKYIFQETLNNLNKLEIEHPIYFDIPKDVIDQIPDLLTVDVTLHRKESYGKKITVSARAMHYHYHLTGKSKIEITITITTEFTKENIPELWQQIVQLLRHELTHKNQRSREENSYLNPSTEFEENNFWAYKDYFTNPYEIEAFVTSLYYAAKRKRVPFDTEVDNLLNQYKHLILNKTGVEEQKVDTLIAQIRQEWINYAQQRYPNLTTQE